MEMDSIQIPESTNKSEKTIKTLLAVLLVIAFIGNGVFAFLFWQSTNDAEELTAVYTEEYFHYNSLTVESFEQKLEAGDDFVVFITRPNCGSCEAIYRDVMEITEEMGINDDIYLLNVVYLHRDSDAWNAFKERLGISGTPSYVRVAGGETVSQVGWTPERGVNAEDAKAWLSEQSDLWD